MYAILTGDLIGSTGYTPDERKTALRALKEIFSELEADETFNSFSLYRGDSFQGMIYAVTKALSYALRIKAKLKMLTSRPNDRRSYADIRIAIGIGEVHYVQEELEESDGPAFHYSGRALSEMKKKDQKLIVITPDDEKNKEWLVLCKFIDNITDRWTVFSAETVLLLMNGKTETEISETLDISQPAVHYRKEAAGWDAIELALNRVNESFKKSGY